MEEKWKRQMKEEKEDWKTAKHEKKKKKKWGEEEDEEGGMKEGNPAKQKLGNYSEG